MTRKHVKLMDGRTGMHHLYYIPLRKSAEGKGRGKGIPSQSFRTKIPLRVRRGGGRQEGRKREVVWSSGQVKGDDL
jgi:hypothetical protein